MLFGGLGFIYAKVIRWSVCLSLSLWNMLQEAKYADSRKHMKRLQPTPPQKKCVNKLLMQLEELTQGLYKDILSWLLLISTFLDEIIKTHSNLWKPSVLLGMMLLGSPLSPLLEIQLHPDAFTWEKFSKPTWFYSQFQISQWIGHSLDNGINPRLHKGRWKLGSFIANAFYILNSTSRSDLFSWSEAVRGRHLSTHLDSNAGFRVQSPLKGPNWAASSSGPGFHHYIFCFFWFWPPNMMHIPLYSNLYLFPQGLGWSHSICWLCKCINYLGIPKMYF